MATRTAAPTDFQKLCLKAEARKWRVKLTVRKSGKDSSLEDLQIEDRKTRKMLAAESLYEQSLDQAAMVILSYLK